MVVWGRFDLELHHAGAPVEHVGPMPSASASLARPVLNPWCLVSGTLCLLVAASLFLLIAKRDFTCLLVSRGLVLQVLLWYRANFFSGG